MCEFARKWPSEFEFLSTIPEGPNIAISGNKIDRIRSYKCLGLTGREFDMGASYFYYNLQSLQGDWGSTKTKTITSTVNSCHDLQLFSTAIL